MTCTTNIDWATTGVMLQGIGTVIGAISVIVAAIIGSRTFGSWKRQTLSGRHIDQAERILTATYNARRGLSHLRSPVTLPHELYAAELQLKENGQWDKTFPESERRNLAMAHALYNRLNSTRDYQRALQECQPMARAFFGERLEKAIEKLNHQYWTVKVYIDAYQIDKSGADTEFRRKVESAIWEGYPPDEVNEVDQIIASQVNLIEEICVPVLRMGHSKTSARV